MDQGGRRLWESFDSPTHTLLPSQLMTTNTKLVSTSGNGLLSSGFYTFYFDSNYTSRIMYNRDEISTKYWPIHNQSWEKATTSNIRNQYCGVDDNGAFVAGDQLKVEASDLGEGKMTRLTLDYDGNLGVYSLDMTSGNWSVSWMLFTRLCEIHGLCGVNSLCSYRPEPECSCLEGFEVIDPRDLSKGCKRKTNSVANKEFTFQELPGTDFWGYELNYNMSMPLENCWKICSDSVSCQAFGYREGTGQCYLKNLLFSGKEFPEPYNDIYLKVPEATLSLPVFPSRQSPVRGVLENVASSIAIPPQKEFKYGYFITCALTLLVVEVILILVGFWVIHKWGKGPETTDVGSMILYGQFCRFSYKELQKATNCFHEELGSGGSGVVYKGVLSDERKVAVKNLSDIIQEEQEFRSELSVIGRIYHMNVVRIWGFCAEKTHRLLVSEFVENGSLDKILFHNMNLSPSLTWSQRYNTALGVAKGLAYLHHECLEWIVHGDVKPENILLDEDFQPKLADFGLVKLLGQGAGAQMLSRVHGTRGYIAPEWVLNLTITGKVDVYSYGVVLLELVMGTRVSSQVVQGEGEVEVEMTVGHYTKILKEKLASKNQSWLLEFVDCRLSGEFNYLQAGMMLKIAVSCVEAERRRRPNMSHVVETLLSLMD
ncbi:putative receptor protein kinase ZmPK1 [Miscanthus floridulus]|uniref:putative receptor protein kinase ZmPK1 n=1 Tax=Miscanthus floridulus TaxID=154761 RepID=UPI00345A1D6C